MSDVFCIVNRAIKLSDPTGKIQLQQPLAYNNAYAHCMRVTVYNDDGSDMDLTGVGVVASFMKANNDTVDPINGTTSGNVAEVVLPPSCYVTPGRFKFTMNLSKATDATGIETFSPSESYAKGDLVVYNGVVYRFTEAHSAGAWTGEDVALDGSMRTVLWVEGVVERNVGGTIIDPGTPVGNIEQAIGNANAAASAATTAATAANTAATNAANAAKYTAPTEASSTASKAYAVGDYFVYNGKLYITTSAIASGGTITPNTNCAEISNGLSGEVGDLKSASTLQAENIPDTVQTITFDSDGNVQTITHTRDNVAVRTDAFTFTESTITEVRTLSTGESLTIVTNTTTLQTTVTYAAA